MFILTMKNEIERLESELETVPAFRQLRALRSALDEYEAGAAHSEEKAAQPEAKPQKTASRPISEAREKVLAFAEKLIRPSEKPVPTRKIVEFLQEQGVEIPGKEPVSNTSAILSHSERFQAIGRTGWRFVPETTIEVSTPEEALKAVSSALKIPEQGQASPHLHPAPPPPPPPAHSAPEPSPTDGRFARASRNFAPNQETLPQAPYAVPNPNVSK